MMYCALLGARMDAACEVAHRQLAIVGMRESPSPTVCRICNFHRGQPHNGAERPRQRARTQRRGSLRSACRPLAMQRAFGHGGRHVSCYVCSLRIHNLRNCPGRNNLPRMPTYGLLVALPSPQVTLALADLTCVTTFGPTCKQAEAPRVASMMPLLVDCSAKSW